MAEADAWLALDLLPLVRHWGIRPQFYKRYGACQVQNTNRSLDLFYGT
jgi:hypothetical protein